MREASPTLGISQRPLSALGLPPELVALLGGLGYTTIGQLADYFRGRNAIGLTSSWALERAGLSAETVEGLHGRLTTYLTEEAGS